MVPSHSQLRSIDCGMSCRKGSSPSCPVSHITRGMRERSRFRAGLKSSRCLWIRGTQSGRLYVRLVILSRKRLGGCEGGWRKKLVCILSAFSHQVGHVGPPRTWGPQQPQAPAYTLEPQTLAHPASPGWSLARPLPGLEGLSLLLSIPEPVEAPPRPGSDPAPNSDLLSCALMQPKLPI